MSRYEPLAQFLDKRTSPVWQAKFSEIEKILGFRLPVSAMRYPAWWANQRGSGHSQTAGWRSVGWRTRSLDIEQRRVTFERAESTERQKFSTISDISFEQRGALEYLIGLGGTMPDFKPAPRT